MLFLTDFLSRVVTELQKAKCFEWARAINDADFALSEVGMALNDTSFMNNHAASWIQRAQVAMTSDDQRQDEVALMFSRAEEILLAMPEWDLLKYYNLACCYALQKSVDRARLYLELTCGHGSEDDWKRARDDSRPCQERLNPEALPKPNRRFPPLVRSATLAHPPPGR